MTSIFYWLTLMKASKATPHKYLNKHKFCSLLHLSSERWIEIDIIVQQLFHIAKITKIDFKEYSSGIKKMDFPTNS